MFNRLESIENQFLESSKVDRVGFDLYQFLEDFAFYFQNLWVPLSPKSFSSDAMERYQEGLWRDGMLMFFWLGYFFYKLLFEQDVNFFVLLFQTVLMLLLVIPAVMDIALQITFLSLGLVTRSLTTLAHMGYYAFTDNVPSANSDASTLKV